MITLAELLQKVNDYEASDLHLTTNSAPQLRIDGKLHPLEYPQLTPADTKRLAFSVLTDAQKHKYEENLEIDFSFGIKGLARFRGNVFTQRGAVAAVFRRIPFGISAACSGKRGDLFCFSGDSSTVEV